MPLNQYTGTYPLVLDFFKIIIQFIWNIATYPIDIGGLTITIFGIGAFVFVITALLGVITLTVPKYFGSDSYGSFSKPNEVIWSRKDNISRNNLFNRGQNLKKWGK